MTRIAIVSLFALISITCAAASASAPSSSQPRPADMPWLCSIDGGRWCQPCATCPQEDTGALCCSGGFCVVWDGGSCGGILGWCENYTTETDQETGIEVATCHDG